jgi:MFS family permease
LASDRTVGDGTADDERQATFREVLANREFGALSVAVTLSWVGDYLARAAVTALFYQATGSVVASAAAFAISYAPWLIGGPVLAAMADRYPYRSVMIFCDLARTALMATVAIPGIDLPVVLVLLLSSALLTPPFEAARSASLPAILTGDRYVVGTAVHATIPQPAQIAGYFLGGALALHHPRLALLINAATFATSALLLRLWVRHRPTSATRASRRHLLGETADGFRLVFGTPALRAIAVVVFGAVMFGVIPEGLAAAWSAQVAEPADRGWVQGMIMAAVPLGTVIGAFTISRLVPPRRRRRLIRPLAIGAPLALVPAALNPSAGAIALLSVACGFAMGGLLPVANGQFVRCLPDAFRARAFGVMQTGLQLLQGGAVLITGLLAQHYPLWAVVGLWGVGGVCLMLGIIANWPPASAFDEAAAAAKQANSTPAEAPDAPVQEGPPTEPATAPIDGTTPGADPTGRPPRGRAPAIPA